MSTQHTPGPWRVAGEDLIDSIRVENDEGDFIAQCENHRGFVSLDAHSNARLIAAAPDQHAVMLALDKWSLVILSAVRHDAPSDHDAIVALVKANRAALAKVTAA